MQQQQQSDKTNVFPVSILQNKDVSKIRSTSVLKNNNSNKQHYKNKSVQIKDTQIIDRYQHQKKYKNHNDISSIIPSQSYKINLTNNNNISNGNHRNQINDNNFNKLYLPHLNINKFDEQQQQYSSNQSYQNDESLTLTHRIKNNYNQDSNIHQINSSLTQRSHYPTYSSYDNDHNLINHNSNSNNNNSNFLKTNENNITNENKRIKKQQLSPESDRNLYNIRGNSQREIQTERKTNKYYNNSIKQKHEYINFIDQANSTYVQNNNTNTNNNNNYSSSNTLIRNESEKSFNKKQQQYKQTNRYSENITNDNRDNNNSSLSKIKQIQSDSKSLLEDKYIDLNINKNNLINGNDKSSRDKRSQSQSQYDQLYSQKYYSPNKNTQLSNYNHSRNSNNHNIQQNYNGLQQNYNNNNNFQNYNVEYPLSSQLASKIQKKSPYLHRSFQQKQKYNQMKQQDEIKQKQSCLNGSNINDTSILSHKLLSTSFDFNINTSNQKSNNEINHLNQTQNQITSFNNDNKNNNQRKQIMNLNTTLDISSSLQMRQSPSSPQGNSSKNRSLSNNRQTSNNFREIIQLSNSKNKSFQNSPQTNQSKSSKIQEFSQTLSKEINQEPKNISQTKSISQNKEIITHKQNKEIISAQRNSSIEKQQQDDSSSNEQQKIYLKFQKISQNNSKDTNKQKQNELQQQSQQKTYDDASSKQSVSLMSARGQQGHSQVSPRSGTTSTTTTKSHHEKLIFKHIQLLLQHRDGLNSGSTSPRNKQQSQQQQTQQSPQYNYNADYYDLLSNNEDCNRFLRHYFNKVEMLFSSIERKDIDHIILLISNLLDLLVEINEINLFASFVLFLGNTAHDFSHLDKAIFFFHQLDIFANLFRNWEMKAEALIRLGECAKELKMYDNSILLLKKGLQFVWIIKDHDRELQIYDNLGLNYFYLGNIKNAYYYHDKYMKAEVEDENTPTKQLSNKNIEFFEMKLYRKQTHFTKLVMINLSLPIKNLFDSNDVSPTNQSPHNRRHTLKLQNNKLNNISIHTVNDFNNNNNNNNNITYNNDNNSQMLDLMKSQSEFLLVPLCDFDKLVTLKNCEGGKLIEKLVKSEEYEYIVTESKVNKEQNEINKQLENGQNTIENIDQQQNKYKLQKKIIPRVQLPGILIKQNQLQKHEEFKQILNKMRVSNVNLEEKVKDMINNKTSLEQIMDKIESTFKTQKTSSFQQQKVNINHLGEEMQNNKKKNQTDSYFLKKKYMQILSEFIAEYIFKKIF